jgi:serine/threonine protein kinase
MELGRGRRPRRALKRGPLPLDEALAVARQIAEALEAAHDKGIVHRDLKPANVKLTPDGKVKVLDFGLARRGHRRPGMPRPPTCRSRRRSPTPAPQAGLILGTAAYMSPEQARGKAVDRRADIWAFGVVLFEMLTGRKLFDGETVSDVLAAVLTREPHLGEAAERRPRVATAPPAASAASSATRSCACATSGRRGSASTRSSPAAWRKAPPKGCLTRGPHGRAQAAGCPGRSRRWRWRSPSPSRPSIAGALPSHPGPSSASRSSCPTPPARRAGASASSSRPTGGTSSSRPAASSGCGRSTRSPSDASKGSRTRPIRSGRPTARGSASSRAASLQKVPRDGGGRGDLRRPGRPRRGLGSGRRHRLQHPLRQRRAPARERPGGRRSCVAPVQTRPSEYRVPQLLRTAGAPSSSASRPAPRRRRVYVATRDGGEPERVLAGSDQARFAPARFRR